MGCPHEMRPDMSVTDIAYAILKGRGEPVHFKELITEVMRVKAISQENSGRLIAQMHTEISFDSRFIHQGGGVWGLREWQNKGNKVIRIRPETPVVKPVRSRLRFDPEEEEEDLLDEEFAGDESPGEDELTDLFDDDIEGDEEPQDE